MKKTRKIVSSLLITIVSLYFLSLAILYFFQETLLFHPEVIAQNYKFAFAGDFEEILVPLENDINLHGVLFKAENSKGLVFYLHGNGGSVKGWGNAASLYNSLGYDLFMPDYRGYGKSGGCIGSEEQLMDDVRLAYGQMLERYDEDNVIIAGYSIGTGPATILASENKPKALLLQAPYYSLSALADEKVPMLPEFVKRYKLETYKYIGNVMSPVYIFHGTEDRLIPHSHAEKLLMHCNGKHLLVSLPGEGHNAINESYDYAEALGKVLGGL